MVCNNGTGFRLHLGVQTEQGMAQVILRVPINITTTKLMSLILKDKGGTLTYHYKSTVDAFLGYTFLIVEL